jgi:ABC-type sugar transport system ATPase subunit
MTLAERIVVLRDGRIEQIGSPMELYERPANLFVAGFIGAPAMNLWPVVAAPWSAGLSAGTATVGVRPEHLELVGEGGIEVELQAVERLGATSYLYGRFREHAVCAELRADAVPRPGERIRLAPRAGRVHAFDAQGQRC